MRTAQRASSSTSSSLSTKAPRSFADTRSSTTVACASTVYELERFFAAFTAHDGPEAVGERGLVDPELVRIDPAQELTERGILSTRGMSVRRSSRNGITNVEAVGILEPLLMKWSDDGA
jgi:hypothetical protein